MNLFIPGIPKSQQAGSIIRTKDGRAFQATRNTPWGDYVKSYIAFNRPDVVMTGPVSVHVTFYLPNVKDKKAIYPVKRPDAQNLLGKTLLDSGNKVLWNDDSQIVSLLIEKRYARFNETGQVGVLLEWWEYKEV